MVRLTHFIQLFLCNVKFFRNPISAIDIHRSNFQMWSWWSLSLRHDPPPGKQPDAASSDSLCGSLRPYGHQHSTPNRLGVKRGTFNCFFTPQNATAAESYLHRGTGLRWSSVSPSKLKICSAAPSCRDWSEPIYMALHGYILPYI